MKQTAKHLLELCLRNRQAKRKQNPSTINHYYSPWSFDFDFDCGQEIDDGKNHHHSLLNAREERSR